MVSPASDAFEMAMFVPNIFVLSGLMLERLWICLAVKRMPWSFSEESFLLSMSGFKKFKNSLFFFRWTGPLVFSYGLRNRTRSRILLRNIPSPIDSCAGDREFYILAKMF